jgi:ribosomal-protein-alanine N-acetyltransferase
MNQGLFLPLCPEDLSTVAWIESRSFEHPWPRGSIAGELAVPQSRAFVMRFPDHTVRPAVAAYIFLRILVDDAHIMKVAVAPACRRAGLAARLTNKALGEAHREGCRRAILEVRASNTAAIRLYARLGFEPIGARKRYYEPGGEDALVMAKNLEEAQ